MSSPFLPSPIAYTDFPQGGNATPIIIAGRNPSNAIDVQYTAGYLWLSSLDIVNSDGTTGSGLLYYQGGNSAGTPNWTVSSAAAGAVNTLSDGSTTVLPSGGNIAIVGTGGQITSTSSPASHEIILSIPTNFTAPGSITSTTTVTVGTDLTVTNSATIGNDLTVTDDVVIGGDLAVTGTITFAGLTVAGTVNLNVTGNAATNIGNASGAGLILIDVPSGDLQINGNANEIHIGDDAAANIIVIGSQTGAASLHLQAGTGDMLIDGAVTTAITVGDASQTGTLTFGLSTAGQNINIGSGINASAQVITIANGASAANTTLNIMSGTGTVGAGVIAFGSNPRVTTIGIANVAPSAARTVTLQGGNQAQNDTLTVMGGAASAGTQSVTFFAGNSAGATQSFSVFGGTGAGTINLGTGTTGVKTINIGGTAANVIAIGNTQTTGSVAIGNALTSGTVTIGGTAGTGTITVGGATNATGQTVLINSGASIAGPNVVSILAGATPAANQTLNIMTGVGSAGTYAVNILTGASTGTTQTVAVGTGSARTDITLGGTGANVILINNTSTTGSVAIGQLFTSGTITIGGAAGAGTITLGASTSASGQTINVGSAINTGAQVINVAAGASAADSTVNILSGNASAGTITLNLATSGAVAKVVNIATGVSGNTVNIATGVNTSAQSVNISSGAAAGNSTVSILSGNAASGTQTLNLATGTGGKTVHIADSAGANAVTIGSTNTTSATTINSGSGNTTMVGNVLKTTAPAFLSYLAATATNKTGAGTAYTLGTDALTEVFDRGSNATTAGVFTAPVTGLYFLKSQITLTGCTIATTFVISIVATSRTAIYTFIKAAGSQDESVSVDSLFDMSSTDTAHVTIAVTGEGGDTVDILGGATLLSYFTGYLVA